MSKREDSTDAARISDEGFKRTLDRSSLGTPPAKSLRARTTDEVAARIRQRAAHAAHRLNSRGG